MDDSAWPSVPWSEYLNGDYEDEYATVYDTSAQNQDDVGPNGNEAYETTQRIDAVPDSSAGGEWPAEECFFPYDADQASAPQTYLTGLNGDGEKTPNPQQNSLYASVEKPSSPLPQKKRQAFSAEAHRMVKEWLGTHADDPYPTAAEKEHFAQSLGLSSKQISTLFNNVRRRHTEVNKTPGRTTPGGSLSPAAIATLPELDKDDTPMSRFLSSSPEEDPQPIELVAKAAANFHPMQSSTAEVDGSSPAKKKRKISGSQNGGGSEISSRSDILSSHSSEQSGSGSSGTSGKQGKRRTTTARPSTTRKGRYYCTYCWKNFASSSSWRKHEESIHKPQKEIECRMSELNPTLMDCGACVGAEAGCDQGLKHNYKACLERTKEVRTFHRMDHFKNHLSGIHNAMFTPAMNTWVQLTSNNSKSRCGFCLKWFPTWTERLDHIGDHYRFHDDFDKSKWRLDGEEEEEAVETATPANKKNGNESSALVKHQGQPSLRFEINSFLNDFFIKRPPPGIPGNSRLLADWESLGLRKIRALDEPRNVVVGNGARSQHYDCPAIGGGECKFDIIQHSHSRKRFSLP